MNVISNQEHYREDYECTSHFDSQVPSTVMFPECDTARSITVHANATLVDRDEHSVDAHPTLDMPALNYYDGIDDQQRDTDYVYEEAIANLTIEDNQPQANIDDNVDSTRQTPTVVANQFGVMASPDPDRSQQNVVPQR
ncbi:hypothetical protein DPMN_179724 [Dreissena polymorpha]|uniref:Uncharacterized protein n=1 Tax=Dreissena polymorpha TaxID=45954 RepID=A0A9D4ECV3_DREPO|nr:hypothetical protein DPMN_179724 [Dreissena polymorpha]